ncbi:hypothetical protein B4145_1114 [Bacillus subtilis]|uniref:Uncharacterized protein n=1 Tax=Bacillus subtilis subsp. subtilis TaxID=135461 RepID=A0ABD3ZZY3_BACIU|nr:hypothetical protein B4067_1168 [Bacillus subtilis subsp. subtilis]KIN53589.1 hypothetical protein B4145_1114 [Bacillus subtilis]
MKSPFQGFFYLIKARKRLRKKYGRKRNFSFDKSFFIY